MDVALDPAGIYLLKVNNRNTKTGCEICSKLTIKTPERRHWRVSIVIFENVIAGWGVFTIDHGQKFDSNTQRIHSQSKEQILEKGVKNVQS